MIHGILAIKQLYVSPLAIDILSLVLWSLYTKKVHIYTQNIYMKDWEKSQSYSHTPARETQKINCHCTLKLKSQFSLLPNPARSHNTYVLLYSHNVGLVYYRTTKFTPCKMVTWTRVFNFIMVNCGIRIRVVYFVSWIHNGIVAIIVEHTLRIPL